MEVLVSEADIAKAAAYQAKVLGVSHIAATPNYTGLTAERRFEVGQLCEIAFAKLLGGLRIRYRWLTNDVGSPDSGDFVVWSTKEYRVDIKGSDHPGARYLMVPQSQWQRRGTKCEVLVGATIKERAVTFHGWLMNWEFEAGAERLEMRVPTLRFELSALHAMDRLLSKLEIRGGVQ